jgi:hypothetical protein
VLVADMSGGMQYREVGPLAHRLSIPPCTVPKPNISVVTWGFVDSERS